MNEIKTEKTLKKNLFLKKKIGQTPLQVIEKFKADNHEYFDVKMSYAGRLDPMAEGVLLVLVGDECKKRDKYLNLDKEYEFEILFGFKSDSQDVLGLSLKDPKLPKISNFPEEAKIQKVLDKLRGRRKMKYPVFSSKTVKGKPLFLWALEKRLDEIEIPKRDVNIYKLEFLEQYFLEKKYLIDVIFKKINSIAEVTDPSKELGQDFRRGDIRKNWNAVFSQVPEDRDFMVIKLRCVCSSGTYMRVLAEEVAEGLGYYGLAFSIKRTKIGKKWLFGFKNLS